MADKPCMKSLYRALAASKPRGAARPAKSAPASRRARGKRPDRTRRHSSSSLSPSLSPPPRRNARRAHSPSGSDSSPSPRPQQRAAPRGRGRSSQPPGMDHDQMMAAANAGPPEPAAAPAALVLSPPRTRVLYSQNHPLLTEREKNASKFRPSPAKKMKTEERGHSPVPSAAPAAAMKESVVAVISGNQQKSYFVDPVLRNRPLPARQYGPGILGAPPFHTVIGAVAEAQRLGAEESITARGCHREISKRFSIDKAALGEDVLVIVRFARAPIVETPAMARLPYNLQILLNQHPVVELKSINHTAPPKKPVFGAPVELPKEFLFAENTLTVTWTTDKKVDPDEDYMLFIEYAERKSVEDVLAEMTTKRISISLAVARAFRMLTARDDEIEMGPSMLNLVCPLSRKRIDLPVRGIDCRHLDCFDASNYLALNALAKARWTCPRCSETVALEDLVVDDLVADLLRFSSHVKLEVVPSEDAVVVKEINKAKPEAISLDASQFVMG
ncbi:hypothetical protein BV898_14551 [Hypsibius exemplaris]|uniref:SP-RING-type domain-containing protein n=1 Tax=Hypsibius exemplaris TaxID=2072580 RepID=A0A9X6N9L9_HYPEX|nr:hypothetical protein BV898_14551 [Hypsibius exemplaris]